MKNVWVLSKHYHYGSSEVIAVCASEALALERYHALRPNQSPMLPDDGSELWYLRARGNGRDYSIQVFGVIE